MTITNKFGLPEPLVRAVEWSDRDREGCDYTITELIKPPRIAQLEKVHANEITEDASDRIWLLLGSAGHEVLRRSADQKRIVEERAIVEVDGFKVGGQIDYAVSDHSMWDYKFTSVYAAKEGPKNEWIQQLNCYRWLARQYGVEIEKLQIVCIYRDWSKPKAGREENYPQSGVEMFNIPLWSHDTTKWWISERIKIHQSAQKYLPECDSDDTWEKPETWAVMKKGGKRAFKLCSDQDMAKALADEEPNRYVEHRNAERPRCENYCRVAQFCSQWANFKQS